MSGPSRWYWCQPIKEAYRDHRGPWSFWSIKIALKRCIPWTITTLKSCLRTQHPAAFCKTPHATSLRRVSRRIWTSPLSFRGRSRTDTRKTNVRATSCFAAYTSWKDGVGWQPGQLWARPLPRSSSWEWNLERQRAIHYLPMSQDAKSQWSHPQSRCCLRVDLFWIRRAVERGSVRQ